MSQETGQGVRRRLYIDLRKWGVLFGVLMVLGYGIGAMALKSWLDRQPHNQVTLADLMLPWRWPDVPTKRAAGYAIRGMDELAANNVQTGIFLLQRGLSGKPDHDAARLALAGFYAKNRYYDGVRRTVEPQLAFGASRELLTVFFEAALEADDLEALVSTAMEQAAHPGVDLERRWWLQRWQARALTVMDRDREALALLERPEMTGDREMQGLRMQALLALDRPEEALRVAQAVEPNALDPIPLDLALLADWQLQQGDRAGLAETLKRVLASRAAVPAAWIFAVRRWAESGDIALAEQYARDYLMRWGSRPPLVRQLLAATVESKSPDIALRVFDAASQYLRLTIEDRLGVSLQQAGHAQWNELETSLRWIERTALAQGVPLPTWSHLLQGVLDTVREPARRDDLATALGGSRMHLVVYNVLMDGFLKAGDLTSVALIAEIGLRTYPQSWRLQQRVLEVETQREALGIEKTDTRAQRRAQADAMVQTTSDQVPTDAATLAEVLLLMTDVGKWEEAGTLVRRVRRARPGWLTELEPLLAETEMRAAAGVKDWLRVRQLAPAMLRRDKERWATWLIDQADAVAAVDNAAFARTLVEVVLENDAENVRARAWIETADEAAPTHRAETGDPAPSL